MWFYNAVRVRGSTSQAWLNNSTRPIPHAQALRSKVILTTSMYLAFSNKIPQSNNNLVHKTRQLHLLNLTTSHIPELSNPPFFPSLSPSLSKGLISPNASLNSSIGLSYLFSQKHSSGQFFKFLLKLSKHFFPLFFFLERSPEDMPLHTHSRSHYHVCACVPEDVYVRKELIRIQQLSYCIRQSAIM